MAKDAQKKNVASFKAKMTLEASRRQDCPAGATDSDHIRTWRKNLEEACAVMLPAVEQAAWKQAEVTLKSGRFVFKQIEETEDSCLNTLSHLST